MGTFCLPESMKLVRVQTVVACASFTLSDYICCKNAHKVWFVIGHAGANATTLTLGLTEATAVAGGTAAAVTATFPIWKDIDHGTTSDALIKQTDAATLAIAPTTDGACLAVFEWEPADHTAGYDCIAVSGSGGHANNTVWVMAFIDERYQQGTPPTAITD